MKRPPSLALISTMLVALGAIAIAAVIAWSKITGDGIAQVGHTESSPATISSAVRIGGPFTLQDHRGNTVSDVDFRGKFMLVYFGYGYCPDVCPTELANMAAAVDALGEQADRVRPIFITVDPARDTVDFLADYVPQFHPRLVGLTGTAEQIASVAKAYRVYYQKSTDDGATDYLMNHSNFVYLMGPEGDFLTMFRGAAKPDAIAGAISDYIAKRSSAS